MHVGGVTTPTFYSPPFPSQRRLGGYPPFSDDVKEYSLKDQIINARYSFPTEWWRGVSKDAMDMIKRLLTLAPKERITIPEALKHPWLQDRGVVGRAERLMKSVTAFNPPPPPIPVSEDGMGGREDSSRHH